MSIEHHFTSFKLELDGGNCAMQTTTDIVAALRKVADDLERAGDPYWCSGTVRDTNGNMVGEYRTH